MQTLALIPNDEKRELRDVVMSSDGNQICQDEDAVLVANSTRPG
jgi:hypothetical protein